MLLITGITSTSVVEMELNDKDVAKKLGSTYINYLYEKSRSPQFYDNIYEGSFPPIPLTSEFTNAGEYTVYTDTTFLDNGNLSITVTYRYPAQPSFSEPIIVLSGEIPSPERY